MRAAAPGLPLFFFARIVALLQTTSDNIIRNGGEGLMLTFENILELFQEYLLRDPEEEVLPCKTRLCPD